MTRLTGRFTGNKQVVRDLQCQLIRRTFGDRLGSLRYFGLCSPEMKDVRDWASLFARIVAVERGEEGEEFRDQHRLLVTAARFGLSGKLRLLRGDVDSVIRDGRDVYGNRVPYPFDVVSLDYSGGLFYLNGAGSFGRLRAIEAMIQNQSGHAVPFLLFLSCNTHAVDAGEVRHTIENIRTELQRGKWNAQEVCDALLRHPDELARLRLYVLFFINQIAAAARYNCHSERVIAYEGNRGVQMLNYRVLLKPDQRTLAPRFPRERLSQLINAPVILIRNGRIMQADLGLPKLRVADEGHGQSSKQSLQNEGRR